MRKLSPPFLFHLKIFLYIHHISCFISQLSLNFIVAIMHRPFNQSCWYSLKNIWHWYVNFISCYPQFLVIFIMQYSKCLILTGRFIFTLILACCNILIDLSALDTYGWYFAYCFQPIVVVPLHSNVIFWLSRHLSRLRATIQETFHSHCTECKLCRSLKESPWFSDV